MSIRPRACRLTETLGGHRIRKHHASGVQAELRAAGKPDLADRFGMETGVIRAKEVTPKA